MWALRTGHHGRFPHLEKATLEGKGFAAAQQTSHHRQSLFKARHTCRDVTQRVAKHRVFPLHPACADPQDEPSAAEIVNRCCLAYQQVGFADRKGGNQWTKANAFRVAGQPGQRSGQVQTVIFCLPRWIRSGEMIIAIEASKTKRFDFACQPLPARPVHAGDARKRDGNFCPGVSPRDRFSLIKANRLLLS